MSFGGLILTNTGRNKMAAAISEKKALHFTHIQLGDGTFNGSYSSKSELTHLIMEIPITCIQRRDNEVLIECNWDSTQAPMGFYLREIGIIGNGGLCYYDNARSGDAEFIDPTSPAVVKQKRFRFIITVTENAEITTIINSGLYALAEDLEAVAFSGSYNDLKDKPTADDLGLGNVADTDFITKAVSDHDVSTSSHNDMRELISGLGIRLNALADSDDETLDQLSEIVAYIKNNKSLIDGVTTSKVSVADIVDNVTSTATNKPLSAKQGKVLKDLITALTDSIPTKTSQLTNDSGFKTTDTNTWKANTKDQEGYVTKGNGQANKVWKTDANGNPGWRDDANTTYGVATTSSNGLLSAADKKAIDNMPSNYLGKCTSIGAVSKSTTQSASIYEGQAFKNFNMILLLVYVNPSPATSVNIYVGELIVPYSLYKSDKGYFYIPIHALSVHGYVEVRPNTNSAGDTVSGGTAKISTMSGVASWGIEIYGIK